MTVTQTGGREMSEFEAIGWYMWDKTACDYAGGFAVFSVENPVKSEEEQNAYGGDHLGHIWTSHEIYKKVEK